MPGVLGRAASLLIVSHAVRGVEGRWWWMRRRRRLQGMRTAASDEATSRATRTGRASGASRKRKHPPTTFLPPGGLVLAHSVPNKRLVLLEASPADDALDLAGREWHALHDEGAVAAAAVCWEARARCGEGMGAAKEDGDRGWKKRLRIGCVTGDAEREQPTAGLKRGPPKKKGGLKANRSHRRICSH